MEIYLLADDKKPFCIDATEFQDPSKSGKTLNFKQAYLQFIPTYVFLPLKLTTANAALSCAIKACYLL